MKKILVLSAMLVFLGAGGRSSWAHDDDKTPDQSLTGEVVCLSCYLGHGGMGAVHAKCAKQCFAKGLPVGLKVGNKLYLAVGEHHGTGGKMLSPYAGKEVTVTGHVFDQEGMSMVEIESVKKAAVSSTATDSKKSAAVMYTCSMHPEVISDKPGQCPKCGMDLVVKK